MSILDGLPKSEAEWQEIIDLAMPVLGQVEADSELSPLQKQAWEHLKEGLPLAMLYGITKEEREAVLAHCLNLVREGKTEEARKHLIQLFILYPYDGRVLYTAGVTLQMEGDIAAAAKMFVQATAMDATNPEGYLRLGECFLSSREYENAAGSFGAAQDLCERGYGSERIANYANKMLAHSMERVDANE